MFAVVTRAPAGHQTFSTASRPSRRKRCITNRETIITRPRFSKERRERDPRRFFSCWLAIIIYIRTVYTHTHTHIIWVTRSMAAVFPPWYNSCCILVVVEYLIYYTLGLPSFRLLITNGRVDFLGIMDFSERRGIDDQMTFSTPQRTRLIIKEEEK